MKKHFLPVTKTARYYTLGSLNSETKAIWIVCHGYGQLAEYFIKKFQALEESKNFVIAPEALSKFYLEGFSGRVGATWMTKEERETEIQDYIHYLNQLYNLYNLKELNKPIIVLGFSQGVSTICRWVVSQKINFSQLILWAGVFPPDLNKDFQFSMEALEDKKIGIVYGKQDPFLKEEHLKEIDVLKNNFKNIKVITFEGKHEVNESVLLEINDW